MHKNVLKGLGVVCAVIFLYGCTSTKGVEMRRYVEIKDRVDQNMESGNAGYLFGTPQPEDRSEFRKTRKIYVLEVSQGDVEEEAVMVTKESAGQTIVETQEELLYEADDNAESSEDLAATLDIVISSSDEDFQEADVSTGSPSRSVEYVVEKDDTLQKISKKFYDSYSMWPKIYDANRDVIQNPDRIKPGITIQIPQE